MQNWPSFIKDGTEYDLGHLNSYIFSASRGANNSGHQEENVRVFTTFSDHCFTDHHGIDESWIYTYALGDKERYFSLERYEFSFYLLDIIPNILNENYHLKRTFNERREQFFYLEEKTLYCDYRIFLEIEKYKNNNKKADFWIKVVSSYPVKEFSEPVNGDMAFKVWRIMDARMGNGALPPYGKKRRRR